MNGHERTSVAFLSCMLVAACRPTTDNASPPAPDSSPTSAPAPTAVVVEAGTSCAVDSDCGRGLVCFYENPGCEPASRTGVCHEPSWQHECYVNRPMCSCDGRTLWGKPCAGIIRERWSVLERCSCRSDSDCKGGQQCFFTSAGCDAPGSCDDPAMVTCPAATATFCSCNGKTRAHTCAQAMRERWSKAAACGR